MKVRQIVQKTMVALSLSATAGLTMADCNFGEGSPFFGSMPLLGGNLTVGRDMPLGAEVYRQRFEVPSYAAIVCSPGTYNIYRSRGLAIKPMPLANWSSGKYAGKVYETGVSGVGVVIEHGAWILPEAENITNCGGGTAFCRYTTTNGMRLYFDVVLIKTGNTSPGTINGSSLPTMDQKWQSLNLLDVQQVSLTGSINIVSRTCVTPDVSVPMGTHKIEALSGINSFTPWKDFSIVLNNCPAFNGFYSGVGPTWSTDGSSANLNARKSNVLQLRLDATRTALNPSQGILSLNSSAPGGPQAASGIGLQVANSLGVPLPLAILTASGIKPLAQDGVSYTIPLKARYIQTSGSVTAGPANASAVFTINYQ